MENFVENFFDATEWDQYVASHAGPDGGLLQSWAWGEVQRSYGRPVRRLAAVADGRLAAAWQVMAHPLPLGQSYWYVPRPVGEQGAGSREQGFVRDVVTFAKRVGAVFIRVDAGRDFRLGKLGFRKMPGAVQSQEELIVDVRQTADVLMSAMKPKTRYNIRVAEKHGVAVRSLPLNDEGLAQFWLLACATAARQKIRTHPEPYYRAMFAVLSKAGSGHLLVAKHHDPPLAAALLAAHNGVLTYLHGGSAGKSSELMAPHLLHWQAIQLAQRLGCRTYNFGGVSSEQATWAGLTRFKHGFAPNTKFTRYGGLWERPIRQGWYGAYRIGHKILNPKS